MIKNMIEFEKNPNPTKDQHFMVDKGMIELIYDSANVQDGESIVEIGGGAGALTDYLVQGNNHVTVIEKDPYYANLLKNRYANMPNVTVVEGDALQFNFQNFDRLVANLPYTITEPFLINLASSGALDYNQSNPKGSTLKSVTLVLSQNSTRKLVAPVQITEGKSRHLNQEFGIMSAICKAFCDLDIVTAVPSEAFYPEPAVTSFVVNLTPKRKKTTVDRIMREILMDKKSTHSSIKRIYQLMLSRGEVYKMGKHKNSMDSPLSGSFTSKVIENQNVYDLNHAQVSQLVQDLIRNDISIKSKNKIHGNCQIDDVYSKYLIGNRFAYNSAGILVENDYGDYDDGAEKQIVRGKAKFEKTYDYMYDSTRYDVLLHRGLEYLDSNELQEILGNEIKEKTLTLAKKKINL